MEFTLEICTDSAGNGVIAQDCGADRIELCDNLVQGGTTPSAGTIQVAREKTGIKLHVLIRPRPGDFLYNAIEFETMLRDIEVCKAAGIDGVVSGILYPDGSIDVTRTTELVKAAGPMAFTFHRAFDMCREPFSALEDIIICGAGRILTSGCRNSAIDGSELIRELALKAGRRIVIMPGSGISPDNISEIALKTGCNEFHLTGRKSIMSNMEFRREGLRMGSIDGNEYVLREPDPELIGKIRRILLSI